MGPSDTWKSAKDVRNSEPEAFRDGLKGRILVIDDDPLALKNLRRILEKADHKVSIFATPISAFKRLEEETFDLIISDIRMPYTDGIEVIRPAKRLVPDIEVILVTGYASLDGAVEAAKKGAYPIALIVRIIAATAQDLKAAVSERVFRQDLCFRLNAVNIVLPGLSERKEHIPFPACHILEKFHLFLVPHRFRCVASCNESFLSLFCRTNIFYFSYQNVKPQGPTWHDPCCSWMPEGTVVRHVPENPGHF
jgi:DNA-binding NtrC family response regulator